MRRTQIIKKNASIPTALVSGGAGFVGSHLCELLLSKGCRVLALDNFKTGKEANLKNIINNPNFAIYNVDINLGLPQEISSVDYIFHLASLEEYLYSKEFVNLDSLLTNSLGTKNLLDFARDSEAKFLLASSTDVYDGRMSQLTVSKYFGYTSVDENKYSLTEAKRFAEALVWEYFHKYQLDVRIARLPEVYGPRMNVEATGTLGAYIKQLIERQDLTIEGEGTKKEYYTYVSDAVAGVVKAQFTEKTTGNIYTLAPHDPVSQLELAYLVRSLADREVEIRYAHSEGFTIEKARTFDTYNLSDINWESRTDIKDGVVKTLEWFGYGVNTNTFKPAILIENKQEEKVSKPAAIEPVLPSAPTSVKIVRSKLGKKPSIATDSISESVIATPAKPTDTRSEGITKFPPLKAEVTNPKPFYQPESFQPSRPPLGKMNISKSGPSFSPADLLPEKPKGFGKVKTLSTVLFAILLGCSVVLAAIGVFVGLPAVELYSNLKGIQEDVSSFSLESKTLSQDLSQIDARLDRSKAALYRLKWLFILTQKKDTYYSSYRMLNSLDYFTQSVSNLTLALPAFDNLWGSIRPDSDKQLDMKSFDDAKLYINNARNQIKLAQLDYSYVNVDSLPSQLKPKAALYGSYLGAISDGLDISVSFISDLPSLIGATGEKKYLVWFQNSNELRPTGGFIGSYGILRFENGKLKELTIDDIYNPDGQIDVRNITVAPPKQIQDYLGEKKLYLRNSNWNPDFYKSAQSFDDLYFKVTGEKVDGYIAVDLFLVKSVLDVTGPVFLAAYNEEISAGNLYERAQYHSDFNYTNGSSQKRSFLTVLGGKLLERLFALPKDKVPALVSSIKTSLDQRHISIIFKNSSLNTLLSERGWDGTLLKTSGDYLYVVNSNLGGTKANYFVNTSSAYEVKSMTRDGLLRGVVTLTYEHTGESSAWPGGPYTNFVRVLTQDGSKLTDAKLIVADQEQNIFDKVVISKEGTYNSFGYGFKLEPKQKVVLIIGYDLPTKLSITKDMKDYSLVWQKQPGTGEEEKDIYHFKFNPPFGMELVTNTPSLKKTDTYLEEIGAFTHDKRYFITLL